MLNIVPSLTYTASEFYRRWVDKYYADGSLFYINTLDENPAGEPELMENGLPGAYPLDWWSITWEWLPEVGSPFYEGEDVWLSWNWDLSGLYQAVYETAMYPYPYMEQATRKLEYTFVLPSDGLRYDFVPGTVISTDGVDTFQGNCTCKEILYQTEYPFWATEINYTYDVPYTFIINDVASGGSEYFSPYKTAVSWRGWNYSEGFPRTPTNFRNLKIEKVDLGYYTIDSAGKYRFIPPTGDDPGTPWGCYCIGALTSDSPNPNLENQIIIDGKKYPSYLPPQALKYIRKNTWSKTDTVYNRSVTAKNGNNVFQSLEVGTEANDVITTLNIDAKLLKYVKVTPIFDSELGGGGGDPG